MSTNEYGNLIEKWKVDLIEKRARRMGFSNHDIPDLQQEIVLERLEFQPEGRNGASEKTAVLSVIDKLLVTELESRSRLVRRANYEAAPLEEVREPAVAGAPIADKCGLRIDLKAAMDGLSETEREICEALMRGERRSAIAKARGYGRSWMTGVLRRLREKLRSAGLDRYLK